MFERPLREVPLAGAHNDNVKALHVTLPFT